MIHFLPPTLTTLYRTMRPDPALLARLDAVLWDKLGVARLLSLVDHCRVEAYYTDTDGQGLILLETVDWVRGRELNLYGIVGRHILKRGEEIMSDLKAIARHKSCSMIGGTGIPEGWKRYAPGLGFISVSTHYVMEID